MKANELLFVYGTLRKGHSHPMADWLAKLTPYIGEAYAPGELYKIRTYCGLIYQPDSENRVMGDLFSVPLEKSFWRRLDEYEGVDNTLPDQSLFTRELRTVVDDTGANHSVWLYLYNRPPKAKSRIPSGDFLQPQATPHKCVVVSQFGNDA